MVDLLREIVSGKKRRYVRDGFNLDLTYITDRILAMCFPSTGLEGLYRNNIDDVVNFLESRHGTKYVILNLSGRPYDYTKFSNKVVDFAWEDHHSPPIELLFRACQYIHAFLHKDPQNVVVAHCNAGKGRTGTLIASYLLYTGRFQHTVQALTYYKKKRFESGGGVTQPSQIRYVEYFAEVLHGHLANEPTLYPVAVRIDKMVLFGVPRISLGYFRPYVEVHSVRDLKLRYTTKSTTGEQGKYYPLLDEEDKVEIDLKGEKPFVVSGDILMKVYHTGTFNSKLAFRFGFNTAFLGKIAEGNKSVLELGSARLDPDTIKDDERFPMAFKIQLHCTVFPQPGEHTDPHYSYVSENQQKEEDDWQNIKTILSKYEVPSEEKAVKLLFKDAKTDDVDQILRIGGVLPTEDLVPNQAQRKGSLEVENENASN